MKRVWKIKTVAWDDPEHSAGQALEMLVEADTAVAAALLVDENECRWTVAITSLGPIVLRQTQEDKSE